MFNCLNCFYSTIKLMVNKRMFRLERDVAMREVKEVEKVRMTRMTNESCLGEPKGKPIKFMSTDRFGSVHKL